MLKKKNIKETKKECDFFFKGVNDIIFVFVNTKGEVVYINQAVKKIFGFDRKEIMGRNFQGIKGLFLRPESAKKVDKYFQQRLKGKKTPNYYELSGITKKGKEIFFEATTLALFKKGKLVGFLAIIRDISEKKKIVARVKKSEDLLKNIFKSSPNAITVTDLKGKIIQCNKETLAMHGFSEKKELMGRSAFVLISKKDRQRALRNMEKTLKLGAIRNIEYTFLKKDGREFPAELSVSVLHNSFNKAVGFVAITKDISERKRIEQIKSDFVSIASHQFRTPLTLMSWYSEMLINNKAGELNSKQRKYLEEIYNSSKQLAELITLLLNISRLELGIFSSRPKPTDIVELANEVIDDFSVQIRNKNLKLKRYFGKNLPLFKIDPNIISLTLQNLISNAIKYTPEKGRIEISVKKRESEILIGISDTGYGIPKSQYQQIFSKFFRGENIKTKEPKGTGLGLYIIKLILEQCGGKIWFQSEEGRGSRFFVAIPFKAAGKVAKTI